jgi:two-component system, cell cycle sensor histidine kinase and response regulator CckA
MSTIPDNVLVVDDEPGVRTLIEDILLGEGYPVLGTGDPWEALGVVERQPIRLLLTDVMMPDMNGCDLAERIEAVRPQTRVLFMSGYAPDGILDPTSQFIAKPFSVEGLVHAVVCALEDRSAC